MEEVWRNVPFCIGHGYYQCSTSGEVRSLDRYVRGKNGVSQWRKGCIRKPKISEKGYALITLCINGKRIHYKRCRLIYETFIGSIPHGMQVNHIDENKLNDRPDNLNLMSPKDNSNWGTRNQRISVKRGKPVLQYSLTGEFMNEYHSTREAARQLHLNSAHIIQVCNGTRHKCGGYIWRYKEKEGV